MRLMTEFDPAVPGTPYIPALKGEALRHVR